MPQHAASSSSATSSFSLIPNRRALRRQWEPPRPGPATRPRPEADATGGWSRRPALPAPERWPPVTVVPHRRRHPDVRRERRGRGGQRREPGDQLLAEGRRFGDRGVVEEAEHPGTDGRRTRRRRARGRPTRRRDGAPPCPAPPRRSTRRASSASTRMLISIRSLPVDLPRLVGQGRLDVHVLGHLGAGGLAPGHLALDPVHPEGAHGVAFEVPGHQVPVPEAEPQPHGGDAARLGPVGEPGRGTRAHRLEQLDERRAAAPSTRWDGRRRGPRRPASAAHPAH